MAITILRCATAVAIFLAAVPAAAQPKQDDDDEIVAKPHPPAPSAPAGSVAPPPPSPPPIAAVPATPSDADARREIEELRARLDRLEKPPHPVLAWSDAFKLTAYIQAQYESHQDSDDQLRQGGGLYNQDRFLVRRARVRLDGEWKYALTTIELDGNTTRGPAFGLRNAHASLRYRAHEREGAAWVAATLGLFDTPFGYELQESPRFRPFMERTTASRSMFPGEPDLGLKIHGALGFFRWSVAALNGEPLDQRSAFVAQDPNSAKDVVFRFGVDAKPRDDLRIVGGVSALRGKGFHPGTDATKSTIEWRDINEDGTIQTLELTPIPGSSATPSSNFTRWLVGADAQVRFDSRFGKTMAYGEVQIGNNMDRGLFPSDPVLLGIDARQLGWYVGVLQDVTKYGVVGLRYDFYDPNSDALDKRGGKLLPFSQQIKTWSPLVGLVLPHARLYAQYDLVDNKLARSDVGVPAKLKSNTLTLRLQVDL